MKVSKIMRSICVIAIVFGIVLVTSTFLFGSSMREIDEITKDDGQCVKLMQDIEGRRYSLEERGDIIPLDWIPEGAEYKGKIEGLVYYLFLTKSGQLISVSVGGDTRILKSDVLAIVKTNIAFSDLGSVEIVTKDFEDLVYNYYTNEWEPREGNYLVAE